MDDASLGSFEFDVCSGCWSGIIPFSLGIGEGDRADHCSVHVLSDCDGFLGDHVGGGSREGGVQGRDHGAKSAEHL